MKNTFKVFAIIALAVLSVSCEDFLNRPSEDSYTVGDFYKNDSQLEMAVNYLYSSPWSDATRFFIYDQETMCGNVYMSGSAYSTLTVNGSDADNMAYSYSLWAVNAHCNTVINNILNSEGPSQEAKNKYIGECLAWKAMTYFMLVRTYGDIPIIHDNTTIIQEASYNEVKKVQKADVYEYIIMTLEKAIELLPANSYIGQYNRIDRYAAEALMSKVYLTKAGVSGAIESGDMAMALKYAEDVINNSGRTLTPNYADVFRLDPKVFQQSGEALFSWLWNVSAGIWTCQSFIQSDVGLCGFDEFGDLWGDWKGPSIDLQDAFGVSATDDPEVRKANEKDTRRKATCMMFGDQYDYFWTDKGGFDFYRFFYDDTYGLGTDSPNISNKSWGCATGANYAKHLYGNAADHLAGTGESAANMYNKLPTHILRLGDIYLVAAEAALLTGDKGKAAKYLNAVRERAGVEAYAEGDITFDIIWKERRLELALEGDRWYDYVRRSYYDVDACIAELKAQRRSPWGEGDFNAMHKGYILDADGNYAGPGTGEWDNSSFSYTGSEDVKDVKASMFTVPVPTDDVVQNPNMASDQPAIHVDVREEYKYNF